ncbi:PREDICTED: ras and EF-hand domain-containing protein homolog isoform X2 [Dinoponera quadriceps]|uniref:Ras and EF-hand domain-containing protein homolog isoform X2 n=1 Tax=Dinoponera quadriceps TaxID=609295 RepID=A0A6P3XWE6_DINQU|nr:PREDICTED: ras and EF-hand domain-containing protein homolog isoform X2 [Dinoponera quadriceps]
MNGKTRQRAVVHVCYTARWPDGPSCGDIGRKTFPFASEKGGTVRVGAVAGVPERPRESFRLSNEVSRRQQSQQLEGKLRSTAAVVPAVTLKKKKKKKSHSLVRKLSLSKFRLSSEQEPRQTPPESGDSSRSQSQSSQESPVHSYGTPTGQKRQEDDALEREKAKGELKKSEKLLEKPVKTVTVVQRRSPSLTIKSFSGTVQQQQAQQQQDTERVQRQDQRDNPDSSRAPPAQCSSTLPYALSRWPEHSETGLAEDATGKSKPRTKSDSDFSTVSKSSPVEARRKLSFLEEKRAIFQRRFFDSTKDNADDSVISVLVDSGDRSSVTGEPLEGKREEEGKRKTRQISVRTFDTFSTFEDTFDGDTGLGYLRGIEEDYTESYDREDGRYSSFHAAIAPMIGAMEHPEKSSNNAPNAGVGEKREHLYKILVIGELGAGKTSIIKRYVHQFFSQHYRATIGVDFALKVLNWDPHTIIRLQLWDIAGQERFGNMTRVYYKEAVGAFIVFDVTRSATLDAVVKWKQDLDSKVQLPDGSPIPCVLLANKCDQHKEGLVNSPNKMDEYCKEKNFSGWFETSAKENINIEEAARFLVNKILQNDQLLKGNGSQDQTDGERFMLNQSPTSTKKSCAC